MTDTELYKAIQHKIDMKTKPPGALGQIEALAAQICALQGSLDPKADTLSLTIFAGDHGIAEDGVSAFPQDVTGQMVLNFLAGGAAANVFARTVGATLRVVDAGTKAPIAHPDLIDRRIGPGTANSARAPAMTAAQLDACLDAGMALGADTGTDAVCFGEMGIGNTTSSALVAHKITKEPLELLVGRGTGVDDQGLARKRAIIAQAASRTGDLSARAAMAEYGGFEIAMMSGAMIAAAQARKLVIVDGFIASAAALFVLTEHPDLRPAFLFAHQSAERGHGRILTHLGVAPLLSLDLRLGEGTGALLAWPLVQAAAAMMNEMASFESAGVSGAI